MIDGQRPRECDAFDLPDVILGRNDEELYGALGRVACLAAVLEDQLRTLLQALHGVDASAYSRKPAGQLVAALRAGAEGLSCAAAERDLLRTYLDGAAAALVRRNDLLHSLWPAQPDGSAFRHRLDPDGIRVTVRTSVSDVREVLRSLVGLVMGWPRLYAIVGASARATR
ncbi:hypothetical protein [Cellulomonas soli]|uniref:Uncharacterized protein n=1 Tax=Cellulomonas soli TaxID=931535 RepID=A0A512PDT8_9CELL|nr:hypothetical protein [Cellulomonas soli]NYI59145.1 hypothetical protein [Cellulomonas soli]GEP69363.1 hypothetical protein CSO01_20780 [Cellulomonas soli]